MHRLPLASTNQGLLTAVYAILLRIADGRGSAPPPDQLSDKFYKLAKCALVLDLNAAPGNGPDLITH